MDPNQTQRWSALASSDPALAAHELVQGLQTASLEDRLAIKDRARRDLVWTLVKMAWRSDAFRDAIISLALLAEAENETWSNNAVGELMARYQIRLGGTAVPYLDRLAVLDELLALERVGITKLVIKALSKAGGQHFGRTETGHLRDQAPEPEWHPATREEYLASIQEAISKLIDIAQKSNTELEKDLIEAASNFSMMLRYPDLFSNIARLYITIRDVYPDSREVLRRALARLLDDERKYRKELTKEQLKGIEELHAQFMDDSIFGQLQQFVGPAHWGTQDGPDLSGLAKDLLNNPDSLRANWAWLTSGDAGEAWRLGESIALADSDSSLAFIMPNLPEGGPDNRLLCGYLIVKKAERGIGWFNDWVAMQDTENMSIASILLEVAWRCEATDYLAEVVTNLIKTRKFPSNVIGQLGNGIWVGKLDPEVFVNVILALKENTYEETAVCLLKNRIQTNREEVGSYSDLMLELVLLPRMIKSSHMTSYYWKELAIILVDKYASQIAGAIFEAHLSRKEGEEYWSIEYSEAQEVLVACVDKDPIGCWQELSKYLESDSYIFYFGIGFPKEVLDKVPVDNVMAWVAQEPEERSARLMYMASKDLSSDQFLTPQLLGEFANFDAVGDVFFSEFISGSWSGPSSLHWDGLADSLQEVVDRTKLPKLRNWAMESIQKLRIMANDDRNREDEEELRGY